jgi:ABC-type uncharacterized transport system permease subunit
MSSLPVSQLVLLFAAGSFYVAASIAGMLQLLASSSDFRRVIISAITCGAALLLAMLVLRAVEISAIPLTGVFESTVLLVLICSTSAIVLVRKIRGIWFGSVAAWLIFGIDIIAVALAVPASRPGAAAATPWAIIHGITMICAAAAAAFAAAAALLYLGGAAALKRKKLFKVLGKLPSLETLESICARGVIVSIALIAAGLGGGMAMAAANSGTLGIGIRQWLSDPKSVCVIGALIVLASAAMLRRRRVVGGKGLSLATLLAFFLLIWAVVGSTVFCGSRHDFRRPHSPGSRVGTPLS